MNKNNDLLSVEEFPLAISLSSFNFTVEKLQRSNEKRVAFCFKRSPGIERIAEQYWKGTLMVNAVAFYQNLKLLKARLKNDF